MSNIGFAAELDFDPHAPWGRESLALVREAGFDFVVWPVGTAADQNFDRALLEGESLRAIAVSIPDALFFEAPEKCLDYADCIGAPDICLSSSIAHFHNHVVEHAFINKIDEAATLSEAAGVRLSLYLKEHDTLNIGDALGRLAAKYAPELLYFAPHTRNLYRSASQNPAEFLRTVPDRCPFLLVEDTQANGEACALGAGVLDWPSIFDAAEEIGVEWFVCPMGTPATMLARAKQSLAYLSEKA